MEIRKKNYTKYKKRYSFVNFSRLFVLLDFNKEAKSFSFFRWIEAQSSKNNNNNNPQETIFIIQYRKFNKIKWKIKIKNGKSCSKRSTDT